MLGPDSPVRLEHGDDRAVDVSRFIRCWLGDGPSRGDQTGVPVLLTRDGADQQLGNEGYILETTPEQVVIRARTAAGLFYGFQTLRQLGPAARATASEAPEDAGPVLLPVVRIRDFPRFSWRGMHLDVCRHFFSVDEVKRFLDLMALHKFNTFHWHLTEDQGWRIEIKKWPKLTEVGSKRKESPLRGNRNQGDGKPYGGYYTQEDIRSVVSHARHRFISIVPEIEMPGHAQAAIAAYPQLGNTKYELEVRTRWGVSKHVYNVEDSTFAFLEDVLTEVMELFPGQYIHIGGDECPKDEWKASPSAQKRDPRREPEGRTRTAELVHPADRAVSAQARKAPHRLG